MSDERVVKVTLRAQMAQYLDGMERARKATSDTASEAQKLASQQVAFTQLGRASLAAGGLIAVGLGLAVAKFAEFDQAMSSVQAATHESTENMEALRAAALQAGSDTVFSATQSANAIEELAKAGISTRDILGGGLKGALDLAAAGSLDVADAAGIAATTMQQFQLTGDKASHVADLLAAGAGKAMGDVGDLSQALKQSGLVANQFGISVEETTGALAAFASNGLLGSDAGTSFRTMLLRLANPTDEVKDLMSDLGIQAYDTSGQFIGLSGLAGELETSLAGMTEEQKQTTLAMIFGQDAIRASTILLQEGKEGIDDWTAAVDDQGYAAETAAIKLDNLKGDIEALGGSVDTALIGMGEAADGPLRSFVQGLTSVVNVFNDMPAGGQQAVFWIGAVSAAAATGLGAWALLVPKMAEYNAALDVLGPKAQKTSRALGILAKAGGGALAGIAGGAVAADLLIKAFQDAGLSGEELANEIKTATSAVQLFDAQNQKTFLGSSNLDAAALQVDKLGDALDRLSSGKASGSSLVEANAIVNVQRLAKDLGELAKSDLPAAQKQFQLLAKSAKLTDDQQSQLLKIMEPYRKALTDQATALGMAASDQNLLNLAQGESEDTSQVAEDGITDVGGAADEAAQQLDDMRTALDDVARSSMDMGAAHDEALSSINDLKKAAEEEGVTLNGVDDASIGFRDSLRDVEQAHRDSALAILENGGTLEEARGEWEKGRQAVIDMLVAKGLDRDEAAKWADANLGAGDEIIGKLGEVKGAVDDVPDKKEITFTIGDNGTIAYLENLNRLLNATPQYKGVYVNPITGGVSGLPGSNGYASGGPIYGPGTGTSDSIPLLGSNGEHMWTAEEVRRAGGHGVIEAWRAAVMSGQAFGTGGGGKSYNFEFHGSYAPTANELTSVMQSRMREAMYEAGVD